MKKLLSVLLVLAVLSGVGIGVLAWRINRTGDQVTVEEETLMGDKSAAEGVTVQASAWWQYKLHWDLSHTLGQTPEAQLTVDPDGKWEWQADWFGIELWPDYESGMRLPVVDHPKGLMKLGQDLFAQSKDGEPVVAQVQLQDYFSHYPLMVNLDLPGVLYMPVSQGNFLQEKDLYPDQRETAEAFHDFFRIPVAEDEPLRVECQIADDGYYLHRFYGEAPEYATDSAEAEQVVGLGWENLVCAQGFTEDLCLFALTNETGSGKPLDFSQVPGGYGIYGFTFHRVTDWNERPDVMVEITDDTKTGVDADSLRLMYPLPQSAQVAQIRIDERHQQVLVVTVDGGEGLLTVLDMKTMKAVQTVPLSGMEWPWLVLGDDFVVIYDGDGQLLLLTEEKGRWRQRWMAELPEQLARNFRQMRVEWGERGETVAAAMDVRDDQLVLCGYAGEFSRDCRYDVAVMNGDGVAYWGRFVTSLASYPEGIPGVDRQMECTIETLDVSWPE